MTAQPSTPVTPAEAKAVWEGMEKPSARAVATKFAQAGRPVSFKTVNKWRANGWTREKEPKPKPAPEPKPADPLEKEKRAVEVALPVLTGDPNTKPDDLKSGVIGPLDPDMKDSALVIVGCREAIHTARIVFDHVRTMPLLMATPGELGKLLVAQGDLLTKAIEGLRNSVGLHEREMKDVPGTQEVIPPSRRIESDPLRDSLEAWSAVAVIKEAPP